MKNHRLVFICTALFALVFTLSSCDLIKSFVGPQKEETKPPGYIETKNNELFVYDVFQRGVIITEYIGNDIDIIVPKTIDSLPVVAIGSLAFFNNNIIETIVLPDTLEEIEASAFYHCDKLKEIELPATVKSLGERAFAWCILLEEIVVPDDIELISDYAFNNCTSLVKVVLPDSIKSIGTRAFSWCTSLTEIVVPSGLESIESGAFRNCSALEEIKIPSGTTRFGQEIFYDCESLTVFTDVGSACYDYCVENEYRVKTQYSEIPDGSESK